MVNQKIYIGQTNLPSRRWSQYKSAAKYKSDMLITRAIAKYGPENFKFEVIATCKTIDAANEAEILIIAQHNTQDLSIGYNLDPGGKALFRSQNTKDKISAGLFKYYETHDGTNKGKTFSEEWRKKLSLAAIGKPGTNSGKSFNNEWKFKLSQSNAGQERKSTRRFSDEIEKEICILYAVENKSTYYLANIYNCYRTLINDILIRNNIDIRQSNYSGHANGKNLFTKEQESEICRLYSNTIVSMAELSRKFNCGKNTIRGILLRNNINLKRS